MRWPKLSRKQKIVCNFLLLAVILYWASWSLDFPVLTDRGLLRRVEQAYLLERGSVEKFVELQEQEEHVLLARYGDQFARVSYEWTLLGKRPYGVTLYEPGVQQFLYYRRDPALGEVDGERKGGFWHTVNLLGDFGEAERAEIEFLSYHWPDGPEDADCITFGLERAGENLFVFEEWTEGSAKWTAATCMARVKLYDGEGTLLEAYPYTDYTGLKKEKWNIYDKVQYEAEGGTA